MKQKESLFFKALHGTILLLLFAAVALAAPQKNLALYWRQTGLTWKTLETKLSQAQCRQNGDNFLGCVEAARFLIKNLGLKQDILNHHLAPPLELVGGLPLVSAKSETEAWDKPKSLDHKLSLLQKEQARVRDHWRAVFSADADRIDFDKVWQWLGKKIPNLQEAELTAGAFNAFYSQSRDPHTKLLPTAYINDDNAQTDERYLGIGVVLATLGGQVVIRRVMPRTSAERAGLHVMDTLLEIDGSPVATISAEDLSQKLRGTRGKKVFLRVRRNDEIKTFLVKTKRNIKKKVEQAQLTLGNRKVGYLRGADFSGNSNADRIEAAVRTIERRGDSALILDLRGNPGGRIIDVLRIGNIFFPESLNLFSIMPLPGSPLAHYVGVTKVSESTHLPMVTLVDAHSASASELLAGAFQDHARSLILGSRTFGKGTVQRTVDWSENAAISFIETVGIFLLPSGRSNQLSELVPDLKPVYSSPRPTAQETFAIRHKDLYLNAIAGPVDPRKLKREFPALQDCVDKKGVAHKEWERVSDEPNDFAIATAKDALACRFANPDLNWEIVSGTEF